MYKLGSRILTVIFISLFIFAGCESVQDVMRDTVKPDDTMIDETPVKLVLLVDYPEGGKDAYIEWILSIASILQAPEEVNRIRSYDNMDQTMSPNRLVEFEFDSFLDAATYLNRPEIADILADLPNHTSVVNIHTFIQRSDYTKSEDGNYPIKGITLIDYLLGGKQAYLDWIDTVSNIIVEPSQLKAIASYDNYYGESPHRLVEFEFENQEDAETYETLEEIQAIEAELDDRTGSWITHIFELRSDYIHE